MKVLLFYLALLVPAIMNAQFDITYSSATNTMNASYTGCEICLLGTESAVEACECNKNCDGDYIDCRLACNAAGGGILVLTECHIDCRDDLSACKIDCGSEPEPVREIVRFAWTLIAAWEVIPNDPRNNETNWVKFNSPIIESNTIDPISWNPPSPWPSVNTGLILVILQDLLLPTKTLTVQKILVCLVNGFVLLSVNFKII